VGHIIPSRLFSTPPPPQNFNKCKNHSLIEGSQEKVRVCGGLMLVVLYQVILGQESNEAGTTTTTTTITLVVLH